MLCSVMTGGGRWGWGWGGLREHMQDGFLMGNVTQQEGVEPENQTNH